MDRSQSQEHEELIDRYLTGMADEAEVARLDALLKADEEMRQLFLAASRLDSHIHERASVHHMEEQSVQTATEEGFVSPVKSRDLSRWPRITAVTAGVVFGVFSSSLVWAFKQSQLNLPQRESREIAFESFEDAETKMSKRFPTSAGEWSGRVFSVPGDEKIPAVTGTRIGKFDRGPEPKFTYGRYLIDLDAYPVPSQAHVRSVEVEASFFTANPEEASVFQIRLGAFSQEPGDVRPIWNNQEVLFDTMLQHVGRNHLTAPGEVPEWHKVRATIEIPPGTRSVVVSLAAGNSDHAEAHSEHYIDAVRVELVDTMSPTGSRQ